MEKSLFEIFIVTIKIVTRITILVYIRNNKLLRTYVTIVNHGG